MSRRKSQINIINVLLVITIIIIAVSLTGCTAEPEQPRKTDISQQAFDLTWDTTPEQSKDQMCLGIATFGIAWAAEQLDGNGLNGYQMAQMMSVKCTETGR